MSRHGHDHRFSSPAVERARQRVEERERARHQGDTGRRQGDRLDLAVLVDELDDGPVTVREDLPQSWVAALVDDGQDVKWSANGDGRVDVTLEREAAFVRMHGDARLRLVHPCVRCGQRDVPFDVAVKLDLRLVERTDKGAPEADYEQFDDGDDHAGALLGSAADLEDLDVATFADGVVAIDAILREQLFLELPAHPKCDSPGSLVGPCQLDEQEQVLAAERARFVDPRWAGLAALRARLDDAPTSPTTDVQAARLGAEAPQPELAGSTTAVTTAPHAPAATSADAAPAPAKKAAKARAKPNKATAKKPKKAATKKATTAPTEKAKKAQPKSRKATKATAKKAAAKKATTKKAKAR